ncbi:MAG: hypothetical protein M3Q93_07950 [Gemmatimonadota bacterium]|nr:hypothetical protein [Gemmatimonadota bacterium]
MTPFVPTLRPATLVLAIGLASCGGDLTLPDGSAVGLDLTVVDGNGQVGTVGQALPDSIVVEVTTEDGNPVARRRVAFLASGGGAEGFDPDTALTNSEGRAHTRWVLGTAPGPYVAQARIVATGDTVVKAVSLQADALPGGPDTVRAAGPTSQAGLRGEALPEPLTVMVVDRFGNPVGGVEVEWEVPDDNHGELSEDRTVTGADGISSVTWTLGRGAGLQRAEARVGDTNGSPVDFTAVVFF